MIWPHLLILSARITLYGTLAHRDEGLYERRLAAARNAVVILRQIQHDDANYHEVAMAVSAFDSLGRCCLRTSAGANTTITFLRSRAGSMYQKPYCGTLNDCAWLGIRRQLLQYSKKKPMRQHKRCDAYAIYLPILVSQSPSGSCAHHLTRADLYFGQPRSALRT